MASSEDSPTSQNSDSDTFQDDVISLEQGLCEFGSRLRDIRSQSMAYDGTEPYFGEGKEVLEAFEDTVPYESDIKGLPDVEEVLEYQEEFEFEHRSTAEMYALLEPEVEDIMQSLRKVDDQKTLKANEIRELVNYVNRKCDQDLNV